jgi:hypothetical protein
MSDLGHQDLARLHTKLVVPFAVGDLLKNSEEITPDIQYALHEHLSEMDPDTALLAIALSVGHISARLCPDVPVACALTVEAEKVLNEYAADWLAHADGRLPSREGDALFEVLEHVPEDLEALADILESVQSSIQESQPAIAEICNILAIQARAHMEIADFVLSELQGHEVQKTPHYKGSENGENVILFPAMASVN